MTRKLATIRRIDKIEKIEGADKIIKATVDGWNLVSAIDNGFMPGDLVIYFEPDSFLPIEDRYEFLRKGCFKSTQHLGDGFRLKTIKLKGQLSQGLIMPLERAIVDGVPVLTFKDKDGNQIVANEGDDVTEALGVKLYEKPIPPQLAGKVKGYFPFMIRKTDQERIQNIIKELLDDLDVSWEVSLKMDGSSMTVYRKAGNFGVCSRNLELYETEENLYWRVERKYRLTQQLEWLGKNYAFQGELMGPGVQGNRESLNDHVFFLFDIWDIDSQKYLSPPDRMRIVNALNNAGFEMPHVHVFGNKKLKEYGKTAEEILTNVLKEAEGPSIFNAVREGIVFKRMDGALSWKAISNAYLLGEKD